MSKIAGYSHGSAATHYAGLLDVLLAKMPHIVADMTSDPIDPAAAARMRDALAQRDQTIADLRKEIATLAELNHHVQSYAIALHERLRMVADPSTLAEARVLSLRPLPDD
ncbi:hypothetical protein [Streptomyces sp. NPDC093261]|uniref:hypothetical protein n=1 Tax=Streptomyces sp. NPDC093261 TaxID=3366037 RepID=UPI00380A87E9